MTVDLKDEKGLPGCQVKKRGKESGVCVCMSLERTQ